MAPKPAVLHFYISGQIRHMLGPASGVGAVRHVLNTYPQYTLSTYHVTSFAVAVTRYRLARY